MQLSSPSSQAFSPWYRGSKSVTSSLALVEEAFQDGLKIFKNALTKDNDKRLWAGGLEAGSLEGVLDAAHAANAHYESKRSGSKVRECLVVFSARVRYYGNIMDVLVQQNPQYVSLAWGAMKLLFGAVVEHENTGRTIVTALNDIADALPRVELAMMLYPTESMQRAVASLYAHILRFLFRSIEWHKESKLKHALHSITRPVALRYEDLITEIRRESEVVMRLSTSSNQAEQRDMHTAVREIRELTIRGNKSGDEDIVRRLTELTAMVAQLRESLAAEHAVNAKATVEFRCKLSDIQLTQALSFISSRCSIDHASSVHIALALRDRHRGSVRSRSIGLLTSPKLHQWNASSSSSAILLKATYRQRSDIRDFCVSVVEQLVQHKAVCLWALRDGKEHSALDLFRSLIIQALSVNRSLHTDVQLSFQLQKVFDARSDDDYVNILGDVLQHFKQVYIIVDTGAVATDDATRCRVCLHKLSKTLAERGARTVVKVVVSMCGPMQLNGMQQHVEDEVLELRDSARLQAGLRRRAKRSTRWKGTSLKTSYDI